MKLEDIKKCACIGCGTIGTSWALNFAWRGYPVNVFDANLSIYPESQEKMSKLLDNLIENKIITAEEKKEIQARVNYVDTLKEAVSGVQWIQENGPETYDTKMPVLQQIDEVADPEAVISSSTSGLVLTELAKAVKHPERLVGGHPYNPPHLMPLVEISKGEKTDEAYVQLAYDFWKSIKKEPVILKKDVSGFICNRLQVALYRELVDLIYNGVCTLEDCDKAVVYGLGLRWAIMGPNMVFHIAAGNAGLQTLLERQIESFDVRLGEMADWKHFPPEMCADFHEMIQEEIANRTDKEGHTIDEITRYRDTILIPLLQAQDKI